MKFIITIFANLCLLSCMYVPAFAQESGSFGLAMHGQPKYNEDSAHLSYVNPIAPKGGTLRESAIGTFDSLNPYAIKGKAAQGLHLVYDRLMQRVWDEPFTLYPLIAKRATIADDRSHVTFILNEKARFQDGSPITADDVLFSYETLKQSGRPNMRRIYALIQTAEKIDEHTVKFTFGEGYDRETVMIVAMMPVLSKAWWQDRAFDSALTDVPLGNGPYKIENIDIGRKITYTRNPDYWAKDLLVNRGQHNFDTIIYDYYRDDSVALEAFLSGALDLRREGDAGRWHTSYDKAQMERAGLIKEDIEHGRTERARALIFNSRRAPFDDINVRKALYHVLDFHWMNENLYHGQYKRVDSYYPNSILKAPETPDQEELKLLEKHRDTLSNDVFQKLPKPPIYLNQSEKREGLRKADALLKEAGWVVQDGVRMKDGTPLSFEILLGSPSEERAVINFTNDLKRLGIAAQIRVLDTAAFRGRLNDYDFDMVAYHWQNSLSPGTEQMLYWSCESAKTPARWNFSGVCHPAIDELATNIANAQDYNQLTAHARAIDRIMLHGYYMIPLYYAGYDMIARNTQIKRPDETPVYGAVMESWWHDSHNNNE